MAEVASDLAASLACPVCLELPAGEVHQCLEELIRFTGAEANAAAYVLVPHELVQLHDGTSACGTRLKYDFIMPTLRSFRVRDTDYSTAVKDGL